MRDPPTSNSALCLERCHAAADAFACWRCCCCRALCALLLWSCARDDGGSSLCASLPPWTLRARHPCLSLASLRDRSYIYTPPSPHPKKRPWGARQARFLVLLWKRVCVSSARLDCPAALASGCKIYLPAERRTESERKCANFYYYTSSRGGQTACLRARRRRVCVRARPCAKQTVEKRRRKKRRLSLCAGAHVLDTLVISARARQMPLGGGDSKIVGVARGREQCACVERQRATGVCFHTHTSACTRAGLCSQ